MSKTIERAPPELPMLPAESIILADKPLLPSLPQPELVNILIVVEPASISEL